MNLINQDCEDKRSDSYFLGDLTPFGGLQNSDDWCYEYKSEYNFFGKTSLLAVSYIKITILYYFTLLTDTSFELFCLFR